MLNPAAMVDSIVTTLQSIPDLAAAMTVLDQSGSPTCRISAYHYRVGVEHRLAEAIYKMPAPSMLVAWDGTQGGNFNGQTIWKHRFNVYFRMGNAAGLTAPVGYEDLWWTRLQSAAHRKHGKHPLHATLSGPRHYGHAERRPRAR